MTIQCAVIMDPIQSINIKKDTTFGILMAIQQREWDLHYIEQPDIFLEDGQVFAETQSLKVENNPQDWFTLNARKLTELKDFDIIFMRKDPPFNMEYIYTTYLLELVERCGVCVVNSPQSLRDANEKLFTAWFPECTPPTLVSCQMARLKTFWQQQKDIIVKPLDGMGGGSVFRLQQDDPNVNVILENLTQFGTQNIMAQRYIPEIAQGDKRVLLIDGEPIPYSLARVAAKGETRANLAAGGKGIPMPITEKERWISKQVGPTLKKKGLRFVGLDIIGDYLTEINVTSPTCMREIENHYDIDIAGKLLDAINL